MKKVLNGLLLVLGLILIRLVSSFIINEIIIWNYNNDIYNTLLVRSLYVFNFNQSYIAYYNEGNILYKKDRYAEAIEKYTEALEKKPPQNRICDVRINLTLATIKTVDENNYVEAYSQLESAKSYLQEDNCLDKSQEARNLEEEIENLQEQLNNGSNGDDTGNNDGNEDDEDNNGNQNKDIEEELKERQKVASASRQEEIEQNENWQETPGYPGKKW